MSIEEMTSEEIDQFLACARVGRLGLCLAEDPYVIPVGYGYADGKIFFHTCEKGVKIEALRRNANVCFEVDESTSDASMFKSVVIIGAAEIVADRDKMIPYLQKLIDKYRVPLGLDEYLAKKGLDREKELNAVRICLITPKRMTGRKLVPREKH